MKKFYVPLMVVVLFTACQNSTTTKADSSTQATPPAASTVSVQNTLTDAEKQAGYQLLFDGKSFAGWRNFRKQTIGKDWIVDSAEQAMYLDVKKLQDGKFYAEGGDIMTDKAYENYELELEWKIDTCGNSGIIYCVVENDKNEFVWQTGPEMQVLDNNCHPDAKIIKHRAGDLYDMVSCSQETVKPALAWNKAKLIVNKGKVEHWLNDTKVVGYDMGAADWQKMIAGSKFSKMPNFGKSTKGHIALQDHGNKVWYRNIKIKELN